MDQLSEWSDILSFTNGTLYIQSHTEPYSPPLGPLFALRSLHNDYVFAQ